MILKDCATVKFVFFVGIFFTLFFRFFHSDVKLFVIFYLFFRYLFVFPMCNLTLVLILMFLRVTFNKQLHCACPQFGKPSFEKSTFCKLSIYTNLNAKKGYLEDNTYKYFIKILGTNQNKKIYSIKQCFFLECYISSF